MDLWTLHSGRWFPSLVPARSFRGHPFDHWCEIVCEQRLQEDAGDSVLTIENQGRRNHTRRIVPAQRGQGAHRRIIDGWVGHLVVDDEVLRFVALWISDIDTQELDAEIASGFVRGFEVVRFGTARCAPLPPEVDHDDFADIVVE